MMKACERKAIVAGHICLDLTPTFSPSEYPSIERTLIPGHLMQVGACDIHMGGVVANTGLAMKFLGIEVSLMGKIGTDSIGELVLAQLNKYHAEDGIIRSGEVDTSYSIVLAIPGLDRIFLHNPGANNSYYSDDIDYNKVRDAALFHFGYPPIMESIYSNNGGELIKIFRKVKELDTATSLDLCGVDQNSKAGRVGWRQLVKNVLPYVDFFVPSIEELCYMIDFPRYKEWEERAKNKGTDITSVLNVSEDVKPLADLLLAWGAKVLMIKCGSRGIYLRTGTRDKIDQISGGLASTLKEWADIEHFEISYKPDQVLSATGAGDTCIAAFLSSILNGFTWQKAIQYAAAEGASCIRAYDALSGLLTFDEMEQKIISGWDKNI